MAEIAVGQLRNEITFRYQLLRLIHELLIAVGGIGGIGGGGDPYGGEGFSSADIAAGIDSASILPSIVNALTQIRDELVNSKSITSLLVQDSTTPDPRYFVRQEVVDQTIGVITSTIVNLDGSTPSPAPVLPLLPVGANDTPKLLDENLYVANAAGTGYSSGDSISNVRIFDADAGSVAASIWYNITTATPIATTPAIGNLKGYEDKLEELLTAIDSRLQLVVAANNSIVTRLGSNGELANLSGSQSAQLREIIARMIQFGPATNVGVANAQTQRVVLASPAYGSIATPHTNLQWTSSATNQGLTIVDLNMLNASQIGLNWDITISGAGDPGGGKDYIIYWAFLPQSVSPASNIRTRNQEAYELLNAANTQQFYGANRAIDVTARYLHLWFDFLDNLNNGVVATFRTFVSRIS